MAAAAGRLIAIEGGEGAGKSTQAALLAEVLGAELTREPGGTALGEQIRSLLLDPSAGPLFDRTELMLMLAARAQHVDERILPCLTKGVDVVVDRFSGSTLAYQGYGRGLPLEDVRRACLLATGGREPDLNVLIDVPVAIGETRRARRPDRIEAETAEFHERVRQGYLCEADRDPGRWAVVDGAGAKSDVSRAVLDAVRDRLGIGSDAPS